MKKNAFENLVNEQLDVCSSVNVDVKNNGSNDLDMDSLYDRYKRISR